LQCRLWIHYNCKLFLQAAQKDLRGEAREDR
jgi:hypothetical protein